MGASERYLSRPWLKHYQEGVPASVEVPLKSVSRMFDEATERAPGRTAVVGRVWRRPSEFFLRLGSVLALAKAATVRLRRRSCLIFFRSRRVVVSWRFFARRFRSAARSAT